MKNLNKILATLNLSSSDTREDTIKSIIKSTLFEGQDPVDLLTLVQNIYVIYEVELYENELKEVLKSLVINKEVIFENNCYSLPVLEKEHFASLDYKLKVDESRRYESFKLIVEQNFEKELSLEEVKKIWITFKEYLYSCFYYYGVKAIEYFHPGYEKKVSITTNGELLNDALSKLGDKKLNTLFKLLIDKFSDYAQPEDIDFINDLGQKTLSFASLGLNPDEASKDFDKGLIDWILYLDTNFLFSILDLHINVETDSCKELLKLVLTNSEYIKIKFRYSELTLKELRDKKKDFENLDSTLTKSAIRALLQSDELDAFSRQYYTNLLRNPNETIHPTEVIDLAEYVLPNKSIEIARSKVRVEHLGESFINAKIQEYQKFIDDQNQIREQFAKERNIKPLREYYRTENQKLHDITLREIILDSRSKLKGNAFTTFNEVRYYGVTLDELLVKYDSTTVRKSTVVQYPTFFKPSFLLNQFVKILPVKTDNYKKAFIKAVSSRGFNKDTRQSNDVIKLVSYLKLEGIDNEDILLNLISKKLFLEHFKEQSSKTDFNARVFFESEINKLYEKRNQEVNEANLKIENYILEKQLSEKELKQLNEQNSAKNEEVRMYYIALETFQRRSKKEKKGISVSAPQINFEAHQKEAENKKLLEELNKVKEGNRILENRIRKDKREAFINKKIRIWRNRAWLEFFIFYFVFSTFFVGLLFKNEWDINNVNKIIEELHSNIIISGLIALIFAYFNGVLIKSLFDKYRNHSNIKSYKESLDVPEDLKSLA